MPSIKGHFDGSGIVLDEPPPATLAVGQAVRVVVDAPQPTPAPAFTPFVEMTATLMNGDDWDERVAVHIDPLDRVPPDFVRRPGGAAGQVKMADDFDDTPDEFKEYL